jgi:hypothetical protein
LTKLLRIVRKAALATTLVALSGCTDLVPQEETSALDPAYATIVSQRMKTVFQADKFATYDAFEISDARWVHTGHGWHWLICVRFQDQQRRTTYVVFLKGKQVLDSRYDVQTDRCGEQTYSPLREMGQNGAGQLGPLH